ncbi:MAG TPA: hemolysin family protein [Candidatus Hydrogenedentes bacterium]|nr:hemolysin family protein [Candidatus Hydrogenedentota bacterium]HOL78127.1 hemolysin family protein [Candidatus Hydrogenedentota bacterium]HPO85585.1 hemolysin family protein [Candidatus Hydrogenedentota bacterium]
MSCETGPRHKRRFISFAILVSLVIASGILLPRAFSGDNVNPEEQITRNVRDLAFWMEKFPPSVLVLSGFLLVLSAFFSGSETAFFSIHRLRLRALAQEGSLTGTRVAQVMNNPARLLSTLLVGNMIVNVLFAVVLGTRTEETFRTVVSPPAAYALSVAVCTTVLVLCGEIMPKVFAVSLGEPFARFAVYPLMFFDKLLAPIREGLLRITDGLFRLTRFHQLRAAPFLTDDEFKAVLSDGEVQGVLEEEERQIIQGILEFRDVLLREILVPRPDVVTLPEDATVEDALVALRHHGYSRMPVVRDNLDNVLGILVVKDLIPSFSKGELHRKVTEFVRPPYFVPETMTVHKFVEEARRHRIHLAVVVDEYGGAEGIVTLDDALGEVVGAMPDGDEAGEPVFEVLAENEFRVEGNLPLDRLEELIGITIEDEEHETLAGFLMDRSEKVLEPGDIIDYGDVRFTVEACEGKRALTVKVQTTKVGRPLREHREEES